MALDALIPDGPLAKQLSEQALTLLVDTVSGLQQTKYDKGELSDFLTTTMEQLISQLIGTTPPPDGSVLSTLQKEVATLGIVGSDLDAAARFILANTWIINLTTDFMTNLGMVRFNGESLDEKLSAWAENPNTPASRVKVMAGLKGVLMLR
jgi:hypothetical protein